MFQKNIRDLTRSRLSCTVDNLLMFQDVLIEIVIELYPDIYTIITLIVAHYKHTELDDLQEQVHNTTWDILCWSWLKKLADP